MQKPAQIEGDAPGGSVYHTHEIQQGLIEATNVLKWKIIKEYYCSASAEKNADFLNQHTVVVTLEVFECTYSL
jgi:hypothetical protein